VKGKRFLEEEEKGARSARASIRRLRDLLLNQRLEELA
jgi:hypothetical protein